MRLQITSLMVFACAVIKVGWDGEGRGRLKGPDQQGFTVRVKRVGGRWRGNAADVLPL